VITLNKVIKLLNNIATDHKQINSWGFGDLWEAGATTKLNFPAMWGSLKPATVNQNELNLNFSIYLMDKVRRSEANENEVLSDTLQIAMDVLAKLRELENSNDFYLVRQNAIDYFTESLDDEVSGVMFDITLKIPNLYDLCSIPE